MIKEGLEKLVSIPAGGAAAPAAAGAAAPAEEKKEEETSTEQQLQEVREKIAVGADEAREA